MGILAKDLFIGLAPYVGDSGVCPDDEAELIAAINEAMPLLMKRLDAKGTIFQWCVPSHQGCFGLPHDCLEVRTILLDGFPLVQRDQWYEGKLSVGQLDRQGCFGGNCNANTMVRYCNYQNVVDIGDFATPLPWPNCNTGKLGLKAENDADAGVEVLVNIINEYSEEVQDTIVLAGQQQVVSSSSFVKEVRFIRKPVTVGNVNGYFLGTPCTKQQIFVIPPRVMNPAWRRKKLPTQSPCGRHGTILIKGKARFIPLVTGNDVVLIDDLAALQFTCRAISASRRDDRAAYNEFLMLAVNEAMKQMSDSESRASVGQAQLVSPFGRAGRTRTWQ